MQHVYDLAAPAGDKHLSSYTKSLNKFSRKVPKL